MHALTTSALIGLLVAAGCAGWIDAVAGGGGLIQLPALLIGISGERPATILGTNKLSSVVGTSAATATYLRQPSAKPDAKTATAMAGIAFIGSMFGAHVATLVSPSFFRPFVFFLLIAVGLWTWLRPALGQHEQLRWPGQARHMVVAIAAGGVIGFYDGIFGPGTGSFLVFVLVSVLGYSFLRASATAKIVNLGTNIAALIVFGAGRHLLVPLGLAMGACNLVGGIIGARMAAARGSGFVRIAFLAVVSVLVLRIGWDMWR